ncbi:MAG TPA: molybdate ABC transporter substrate-binding protein [Thermoanaerobaculia bacterium]|jgi:molybdate transport system substrate-binding protein|nr:molybdate ABC transporter substrate-binding protein [Thermoanaerobaculia bacterium]
MSISRWRPAVGVVLYALAIAAIAASAASSAEVSVAVAANFSGPLDKLAAAFEKETGHHLLISSGSSGKLYVQITAGAPFEVMLSADSERPLRLEKEGAAVAGSRFTYAIGRLVLWSKEPGLVDSAGAVLAGGGFRHLAVPSPENAPYGAAARQVLQGMDLWQKLAPRIVQGEDIGQTYQFVATGNAELGFVALSQIRAAGKPQGSLWIVPAERYRPIEQQAVLLARGKDDPAARAFLEFLRSAPARALIQEFGYGLP